jgi:ADP-ribose pyrophosphatase
MGDLARSTARPQDQQLLESKDVFSGTVIAVRSDRVRIGECETTNDVVTHPGSAAVVALRSDGNVLLVRRWHDPVAAAEWELPAALCDQAGERAQQAAERELAAGAGVSAPNWRHLLTVHTSPAVSTERCEIFLATHATVTGSLRREPTPPSRPPTAPTTQEDRGGTARTIWVELGEAVEAVRSGEITSAPAVAGLLALAGPPVADIQPHIT